MAQYKFSCPACGQHFAGDFGYCGLQMTCPACQNQFIVPSPGTSAPVASATAPRAQRTTVALPAKLPLRPPQQAVAAPIAAKTSGLAVASLVCSIGSFVIIPLFIPGIICGHVAMKRIAQNPALRGRGMAKAGLIIGYVALVLSVLVVVAILVFGLSYARLHHG
ncbi:MAG TPA: DUF4190 domain-containing protein [Verrucomicrobiae bacterium]|nr:DUF4190 domain-containing protein [Verrucomicrobiae bacterium]